MTDETRYAIEGSVATLLEQVDNTHAALVKGDTDKLEKSLRIIEKVARVLLVVLGAISQVKTAAKGARK